MNATECPPCPKCGGPRTWKYFDHKVPNVKPFRQHSTCTSDVCREIARKELEQEERRERERPEQLERERLLDIARTKENCGFKKRHMSMTFENWDGRKPKIAYKKGAYLYGDNGRGKTHLLCAIGHQLIEQGFEVVFINAVELLNEIKESFDLPEVSTDDVLSRYSSSEYLLLDDLGAEKGGAWVIETFYLLLNRRWEAERVTLVTSNLEPGEIAEKLGKRIASRLLGNVDIREIKAGTDRRKGE